jgi:4-methyl-5(b-hydroxyethyl)-thiazole monophosphate biosynthesis
MKRVLVLLAEGFEEVEALTPVDYLRRVGIETITASIMGKEKIVKGSHDILVTADATLSELKQKKELVPALWDAVILPGGMPGTTNLASSKDTCAFVKEMAGAGKWVCAICAAPALALAPLGLLEYRNYTCYPGLEEKVTEAKITGAKWLKDRVVVDVNPKKGGIITSRGAGTAGEFSVAIIKALLSEADAKGLAEKVLLSQ